MDSLTTAEAVTRHLRSKNIGPKDAEQVASSLWSGALPVYLPNSPQFLFELLCDRMGDAGAAFSQWKLNPGLWRLWSKLYHHLSGSSVDVRNAVFSRVKLLQIMTAVLDESVVSPVIPSQKSSNQPPKKKHRASNPSQASSHDTIREMFACVQNILAHGYVEVDEYVAVGLLGSYCQYISQYGVSDISWTHTIKTLYELPQQHVLYKPGKKSLGRYVSQVVPVKLDLFTRPSPPISNTHSTSENVAQASSKDADSAWTESVSIMHDIFCTLLFKLTTGASLVQNLEQLVQEHQEPRLPDTSISRLFHEIISNLAASEIQTCETIYRTLVQPPYSHLAEELVSVLAKVNRTLSPGFYASIHADAVAASPVNWTLVSHIMKLHPVLHAEWKPVVDGTSAYDAKAVLQVAQNVLASFAGARELPLFMSQVYPHAAQYMRWTLPHTMDLLAAQLTDLSPNSLLKLAKQYLDSNTPTPMALLVRVLSHCPAAKQKHCQAFFTDVSKFHGLKWTEVLYQVLSLYPETDGVTVQNKGSMYDAFVTFRLGELEKPTSSSLTPVLQSYIEQLDEESLSFFLQRWLVLVERKCPELYPELLAQIFRKWDTQRVMEFLKDQQLQVCEMPSFLQALALHMQEVYPSSRPTVHAILCFFPEVVIRKFFSGFIPLLIESALNGPADAAGMARSTLLHLLAKPTLSSSIEKSFDALYKYVTSSDAASLSVTLETAGNIWTTHLRNIKSASSTEFVEAAMKKTKKLVKGKEKNALFSPQVLMAHRFLSVETGKVDLHKLTTKYISFLCSSINSDNLEQSFSLLDDLPLVSAGTAEVSDALRKFGSSSISTTAKTTIFSLVSKTAGEEKSQYVMALFLVLETQMPERRDALQSAMAKYLSKLSDQCFEQCFATALADCKSMESYSAALLDLVGLLASLIRRDNQAQVGLLASAISAFLQHGDRAEEPVVMGFLTRLTAISSGAGWAMTPFMVELVLNAAHKVICTRPPSEPLFVAAVKLVTYVINSHRSKFYARYHVVMKVVSELLPPLAEDAGMTQSGRTPCAHAVSRLITTLCEPPVQTSSQFDSLTSSVAVYRAALRKHAHVILVNYIRVRLDSTFSTSTNDALMPGLLSLIGLFTQTELELISSCLDSSGRTYFQSLYAIYTDHGKWKE